MAVQPIWDRVNHLKRETENLSVEELKTELSDGNDALVVDIPEIQARVDKGAIPGARYMCRGECWSSGQTRRRSTT